MAIGRKEPHEKDKTIKKDVSQVLKDFIFDLRGKVTQDIQDTEIWRNKMATSYNQRLGVKWVSDYPYEGAPDVPLPETDKLIKKATPNLVLSQWSPKKLCLVNIEGGTQETPELKEKARKSELAMNMILRNKMDLYKKLELAADYAKEKGFCVFKTVEEFKTRIIHKVIDLDDYEEAQVEQLKNMNNDQLKQFLYQRYNLDPEDDDDKEVCKDIVEQFRSGETVIRFDIEEISSLPNIEIPLPTKITVPTHTTDLEFAYRIREEFYLTQHELEDGMDKGIFIKRDIKDLKLEGKTSDYTDDILKINKERQEGTTDSNSGHDLYRMEDVCVWYKDGDDWERWVFTFFADVSSAEDALARMIPFPFEFEEWNYDRFDNERKDPRHYNSRGLPEQIRSLQEVMERSINNAIIRDEHNNNPTYEVLNTSEILQRDKYFAPGDFVPVHALGQEIRALHQGNIPDISSQQIIQFMKASAEEYLGSTDQLFRNATNVGGGKTLGEVREGMKQAAPLMDVEVIRFNEVMSKVYKKVFNIMRDRLGKPLIVNGVTITKEDFNFPADVRSNGSLEVADKNMSTYKAWNRLQAAYQAMQIGIANKEDAFNAYVDWLEKDGVKLPDNFSTDPKIIMQEQLAQMEQAIQQRQQQLMAMDKTLGDSQKDLAKTKKKTKEVIKEAEGEYEAVTNTPAIR